MYKQNFLKYFILLLWIGFSGCSQNEFNVARPESVPAAAQLTGGIDGWDWVDCKTVSEIHLECKVYDQLGNLTRTSFLRPCLNVRLKTSGALKVSRLDETLISFSDVNLYEYKPSLIVSEKKDNNLAMKYYQLFGVDDSCNLAGANSELVKADDSE